MNDEIWLPSGEMIRINACFVLPMKFNEVFEIVYSDYKKFSTESRIISTADQPTSPAPR